uniref:Leucine-rich repeat and coiled-coil domain-containing protein 1 n=1 Tax=Callorhinchus milii TaxID=7868 RepID=A0A4W3I539_CALMI|eukprot:gi/632970043/ref/XP_007901421.1/ PREDICTED: leucine-rich repeat and coiled-coil domain-containing protein 1 isoform X2 [Callorhinchus milii]
MAHHDQSSQELCLIDRNITSLSAVPINSKVQSLNLHCNQISKLEGLSHLWQLRHLDLSSNQIVRIEGLGNLISLRTLNLSCNLITQVEGFLYLHGAGHKLSFLDLHSNCISTFDHLLQCMTGLCCLSDLTLVKDGRGNPVCQTPGYRELLLQSLPQLALLDGISHSGKRVHSSEGGPLDIPGLEDYAEYLVSSDSSVNPEKASVEPQLTTPRIDEVLAQYHQRTTVPDPAATMSDTEASSSPKQTKTAVSLYNEIRIKKLEQQISQLLQQVPTASSTLKAKRDIDHSSGSEIENCKENHKKGTRRTKLQGYQQMTETSKRRSGTLQRNKKSESDHEQPRGRKLKSSNTQPTRREDLSGSSSIGSRKSSTSQTIEQGTQDSKKTNVAEESTYRALIQELDLEREKRWKAEQAVKPLMEHIKSLQNQVNEKQDVRDIAVHTTDRLKDLLLKEKEAKKQLEVHAAELRIKVEELTEELANSRSSEKEQRKVLKSLEETISKTEARRLQHKTMEMKRIQEAELKASVAHREVELLQIALRQEKEKVHQLQELLTSREQEHRKEVDSRVTLSGPEFRDALSRELAKEEERHSQQLKEYQEKINVLNQQYVNLEDEFRVALTIEANRFKEVKDGFDHVVAELADHKHTLARSQQKEKQSRKLIQELTAMVKEQKAKIAELAKSKQGTTSELKSRIRTLEHVAEEDKKKTVQIELLKLEKSKLISQLTAQESVIDGLRAERRIWGQELAQQGSSLAQDRGRLEARIEVLTSEIESIKKQNVRDIDALKIKNKIVDDQTETIRKLKEGLQERDEQIRKVREENLQTQRRFQEQLDDEAIISQDLKERVERLSERKNDLKQQLEDKEAELEETKKAYSAVNKKWQDKAELLTKLEIQVKQMKENFDANEKKLVEERNKALQAQKATVEKLHSMDDAFRRQHETVQAAQQAQLIQLENQKQKEIEAAKEKVYQVEEEMRQLLQETAKSKKNMEEKIRKLTHALSDIQQEL